jgi:hypothetical protein
VEEAAPEEVAPVSAIARIFSLLTERPKRSLAAEVLTDHGCRGEAGLPTRGCFCCESLTAGKRITKIAAPLFADVSRPGMLTFLCPTEYWGLRLVD